MEGFAFEHGAQRKVCAPHACKRHHMGAGLVGGPYSTGSIVVGERLWSKPWSRQQPDPATLGLCSWRGWELSNPGGTGTVKFLKAGLGCLDTAGPFCSSVWLLFSPLPIQLLHTLVAVGLPTQVCPVISFSPVLSVTQDSLRDPHKCLMPVQVVGFPRLGLSSR